MGRTFSWCPYEDSNRARWFARFHGGFALLWTVLAVGRFSSAGATTATGFLVVAAIGSMISRLQVERPRFRIDDAGLTWRGLGAERSLPWERVEAIHVGNDGGSLVAVVDVDREVDGIPQDAQRDLDRSPDRMAALRDVLQAHATQHGFALRS